MTHTCSNYRVARQHALFVNYYITPVSKSNMGTTLGGFITVLVLYIGTMHNFIVLQMLNFTILFTVEKVEFLVTLSKSDIFSLILMDKIYLMTVSFYDVLFS